MSKKLALITLTCLALTMTMTSPAIAQGKKKGSSGGGHNSTTSGKGIFNFMINAVDVQNKSISVKINNVPTVVTLHPSYKIFMYQGTVTLEHFAEIAVGKPFRVSITSVKEGYMCDQIWDGIAFTDYRKKAAHAVGRILNKEPDYLRVENLVFRLNKDTKYRRNGKDKRNNPFVEGMRVSVLSVASTASDQTPIATMVSDVDIKPLSQGVKDSIKNSDKKVSGRAKDQLKSGVKGESTPKVKPKGSGKSTGGGPKGGGGR